MQGSRSAPFRRQVPVVINVLQRKLGRHVVGPVQVPPRADFRSQIPGG